MIGAWLEGGRVRARDDLPPPRPGPGEALVRVLLAGVCGTDLELLRGYRGFRGVPGHEFVGVVETGPPEWIGTRVVSEINVTCAARSPADPAAEAPCPACAAGRRAHCRRRAVVGIDGRDGAFAERVALPVANLHRVPDEVDDEAAVFAEPLAAAFRILEQVPIGPADRVAVVGPGRLGRLVVGALAGTGCGLTVTGRAGGAPVRTAGAELPVIPVSEVEPGVFDVAVDCTGHPDGLEIARRAVRPAGTIVLKSTYAGTPAAPLVGLVLDEIAIVGSRCGPFAPALDALRSGAVDVASLIDDRLPLAEAPRAFERAAEPGALKVLLAPDAAPGA